MADRTVVYQWQKTLLEHLPSLTGSQAYGLALWSWGTVLCHTCSLSAVSLFYAVAWEEPANTLRQQLREWYYEADQKRGRKRRTLDVESCFAPLLAWILQQWRGRQLTLALDATTLDQRFVVLCISVVIRGHALPVAWQVLPATKGNRWRPHWLRLLRRLRPAVPKEMEVLVMADRGIFGRWLFKRIVRLGWHPFLRINGGGLFRRQGQKRSQPLSEAVRTLQGFGSVAGVAFTAQRQLPCTLGVYFDKGCADPWLILSDLEPERCQACWYRQRAWIEHGFKCLKSEGWQWQRSRMKEAERANRLWLVLAISTLWVVLQGSELEDLEPESEFESEFEPGTAFLNSPPGHDGISTPTCSYQMPATRRSVGLFRRGWIAQIAALWQRKDLHWNHFLKPETRPMPLVLTLIHDTS